MKETTGMNRRGNAMIITMMLLVILTAIGVYAVSITTTEMDISLHSRVGTISQNVAEAGVYFGIDAVPITFDSAAPAFQTLTVGPNMTATYRVTSGISGALVIQPGYGANFRFANYDVTSTLSTPPSGFTASNRVDATVNYGPIPAGTSY